MDEELYQLCRDVYDRTGWESGQYFFPNSTWQVDGPIPPLYTADYLLDKLKYKHIQLERVVPMDDTEPFWGAIDRTSEEMLAASGKTPTKVLLVLAADLHEAGELKEST